VTLPRIAILGAGPIGLEAALLARTLGHPVTVYEAGDRVGSHVREWGHVRMFTPWSHNRSELARRRLAEAGVPEPDAAALPTGREFAAGYLEPLTRLPEMEGVVRLRHRVIGVGRTGLLKGEAIPATGDERRTDRPFRLLLETPDGEAVAEADLVLDATGVFSQPNLLGADGIPARGERALAGRIATGLPDVNGVERPRYQDRTVAVVGAGYSAATTVMRLVDVAKEVHWITREENLPMLRIPGDSLPERDALAEFANALVTDGRVKHYGSNRVHGIEEHGNGRLLLILEDAEELVVDEVIAQTGFHPDASIHRELQVHQCYASEGTMNLAAALLGAEGGDCMTQTGFGPETLKNPEPGFFIVGMKSYGRNPDFLLRIGREQVRDVFRLVTGDPELDPDDPGKVLARG
jgi:thioredoxin reductase